MIFKEFQGKQLSMLGFGTMRFPQLEDGSIDEVQLFEMTKYAIEHGVNYFDTAYPYHGGASEGAIGRALAHFPRESFYLADKYPGHQLIAKQDPAIIFEDQLKKCGVEYFDFYLFHNVNENSIKIYTDEDWGILAYLKEQKRLGRIKHLGFSAHGTVENMKEFLDYCGKDMEFCQIQLNYLDWTLQDAKAKCELLAEWGIPVWVMEPVRGGKLAKLSDDAEAQLKAARPDESIPAWCFRFLQGIPGVTMVLSGMSNMEQMMDNVKTFSEPKDLSEAEVALLMEIAEGLKNSVPCTACRYCCDGCPMGLDIPMLISLYNDVKVHPSLNVVMRLEGLPEDKRPSACIGCGQCTHACPQQIQIPEVLADFADWISKQTSWAEICRQRAAASK